MLLRQDHPAVPEDLAVTAAMVRDAQFGSAYRELGDVAAMRAATERLLALPIVRPVPAAVRREAATVAGVPGEWLLPARPRAAGTLVFLHGGGYVRGSLALGRSNAADLALASGLRCFCPAYRQAPEHRFPAPVEDAVAVGRALAGAGPVLLAGESVGGGIAVGAAMRLRDTGGPRPAAVAAISPFLDLTCGGASWQANAARDIATRAMVARLIALYAAPADWRDPLASPVFGRCEGLPPLLLAVGGHEVLLSETETLAAAAAEHGEVALEVFEAMPHGFIKYRLRAAELALRRVGAWLEAHAP